MVPRLTWFALIISCIWITPCWGKDSLRIMLLPFEINAQQDLSYLEQEIPKIIARDLASEGAVIVPSPVNVVLKDLAQISEIGRAQGLDHVIWGSLTWIADQFSLDALVLDPYKAGGPETLSVEGRGLENLSGKIGELSRSLAVRLFELVQVSEVQIEGNLRIEAEAILRNIRTKPGDTFSPKQISQDLNAVFQMGYFDDVRVKAIDLSGGRRLIFEVKEKPTILGIGFSGNKEFDDEKLSKNITIKAGSILNNPQLRANTKIIADMYKGENYYNVKVDYRVTQLENNQANVEFDIVEGEQLFIESIRFVGNQTFSSDELADIMRTKEKGIFHWFTGSGELDMEKLNQDTIAIGSFYQDNGFINVKVADPEVVYEPDAIAVTIKIAEGDRYKMGRLEIDGDLIRSKEELAAELTLDKETYFNRGLLQKEVLKLTDLYGDEGYAYAQVTPRTSPNPETLTVDVTLTIAKNQLVYFEEIVIGGNTKTRDYVIRRELKVYEQELYNRKAMKQGIQRLHALGFFEDIKVNTLRGDSDDQMILKLDVTEKPTGTLSFGGGFSSTESLFGAISVDQKNLFGRGQLLRAKITAGMTSTRFDVLFAEPWLFDIPLYAGVNPYYWETSYNDYGYDKNSLGIKLFSSYPVFEHTRASLNYVLDRTNINITDRKDASENIKKLEGDNVTSAVTTGLRYDSRNRAFNPDRGTVSDISVQFAGLGGDFEYLKYMAESGWYFPLIGELTSFTRAQGGYLESLGKVPDYEKFFIGGISTVRGVAPKDVSPRDKDGNLEGGETYVAFNFELLHPIGKEWGLVGLVFVDMGDVWKTANDTSLSWGDMVKTWGGGIRWSSPLGPLRFEYGYVFDEGHTDASGGKLEFTMGTQF